MRVHAVCLATLARSVLLALTAFVWAHAVPVAAETSPASPGEGYVGEMVCRACHNAEGLHWDGTIHAEIFTNRPRTALERRGCEACHGPGAEHLKNPNQPGLIIGFTHASGTPIDTQNETCLQCHSGGDRTFWRGSAHDMERLGCADCHDPMTGMSPQSLLRESSVNDTCFTCHPKQRLEFRKRSHMPLHEGKISCVDCHNPHGGATEPLLRADSVNQLCFQCHSDKRGPFLWEHAPVSENCLNCHMPHGSNRERLLRVSMPSLCQQCHMNQSIWAHAAQAMTPADVRLGDERIVNRACLNCHSRIHGSNHPSGARLHR